MKTVLAVLFLALLCPALRGEEAGERVAVPFSDPGKPGKLEVSLINGGITVTGYEGKEVIIESKTSAQVITPGAPEKPSSKYPGMKRLSTVGGGLRVEEAGNVMEISSPAWKADTDLAIRVPVNTSLELNTVNNGAIRVENVSGEIEAAHVNGDIILLRVTGAVAAHTVNGKVAATFGRLDGRKPVSLVSFNGDVDLTLPGDGKATLKMSINNEGEIYSDFDLAVQTENTRSVEDERGHGERHGRYRLNIEKTVVASLNGGGPEIILNTFNGDILLRKAK
jgi:DUF4097 and DUF4098 domain-containing protein YvlB